MSASSRSRQRAMNNARESSWIASMSGFSGRVRETEQIVANLPRARAEVVAAGADVDFVITQHCLELARDHALIRRPQSPHRRIGDAG
jgi:hypothetical protein